MKSLTNYYKAVAEIQYDFIKKYYDGVDYHSYWVADQVGGVFYINDLFFSLKEMIAALEVDAPFEHLLAWKDYEMNYYNKEYEVPHVNVKDFLQNHKKKRQIKN